ncbi:MAG: DNA topoisomerase IV subunit A [Alphaproteobacteria bacterium]|nr:DNA topoisomerase IV subunit A [Alphaproteobacteria bacterium]
MSDETAGIVEPVPFSTALGERYLAYALSTITARSLPDVRDGLKPVHRRLVHAMRELGLDPAAGFKKCARVVGDVMGKYHPHGDAAIYDAMVRLAQEFAVRYPLVEGHGNFGNIDGDNAAAMRYTEARLTAVAEALLEGIDEDAVDFRETYDGEGREPEVLPAAFPNLLANGAQGIAVGMATNIPPHNVGELTAALLHLIRWPTAKDEKIAEYVPGPDFPTGGCLTEDPAAIAEAYRTGRGSLRVRARWEVEKLERGHWRAVVTETPYQVQKARLLERLDAAIEARKLPAVEQVIDESAEDVRILLVPRNRSIDPAAMMEQAFRQSELEIRFGLNLNVLDADGRPRVMSLRECLLAFIEHRMEVLERRTRYRLERIARRLEVLEAYLAVYLNLDEVIRIVREEDDPRAELCACLGVNEAQADAILAMRLRALRRLEEAAIREEHAKLTAEQAACRALLADEKLRRRRLSDEVKEMRRRFGSGEAGGRRTLLAEAPAANGAAAAFSMPGEPATVLVSEMGWVRVLKGHIGAGAAPRYKEGDSEAWRLAVETSDKLLLFAASGRVFTVAVDRLPDGRGMGRPLRMHVDMAQEDRIVSIRAARPDGRLLLAAEDGRGFVVREDGAIAQTRTGRQVMTGKLKAVAEIRPDDDSIAVIGRNRRLLIFPLDEAPELTRGRGVRLQRYERGGLADVTALRMEDGLVWRIGGRTRREGDLRTWLGRRGGVGRLPPHGFPRNNRFTPRAPPEEA